MFNEFQMENLIKDIQSIDSLNFLDYQIDSSVYRFFVACEHGAFDYLSIIMQIILKYDLITVAAFEDEDYLITLEAVSFNRFGAN
jgi:hypothetical protein